LDNLVYRDAGGVRIREQTIGDWAEKLLATSRARLPIVRLEALTNEGANATLRGQDAGAFELGVHLRNGVGVDVNIDGELPHCRQPVAGVKTASHDRSSNRALELRIDRERIMTVDGEHGAALYYTISTMRSMAPKNRSPAVVLTAGLLQQGGRTFTARG
jgi:hypothetical protein